MKSRVPLVILLLVLGGLAAGLAVLFRLRLAHGDVFPPYSSLRTDPLGTRALHDSLAQLPRLRVEREHGIWADWEPQPPRTVVIAGLTAKAWARLRREEVDALDTLVRGGSRVVVALRAEAARTAEEREEQAAAEQKAAEVRGRRREEDGEKEETRRKVPVNLRRQWGVEVRERVLLERRGGAARADEARAEGLPDTVAWRSDLYFETDPAAVWRTIYERGRAPVLVERRHGRGTLVLAADAYFLSNEALQRDRVPALLAWLVGPHTRVMFDETHLGVVAQPGVAALARRYGLGWAFVTLLLLAALFVWRQMALFVPPPAAAETVALAYHPAAGLEALLRRSVAPGDLAAVCAAEWKPTARAGTAAQVEAACAALPPRASPVEHYNAAVRALRRH